MTSARSSFACIAALVALAGCGGDQPPQGDGGTGGAGGTGGTGAAPPLMVRVTTLLELEEDCAGPFDTSPPPVGEPATFTVDGDRIIVRGTLGPTTSERLQAALDENPDARTLVMTNVPGTVDAAQSDQVARTIRRANLGTCVPDNGFIASGAVEFFLGGSVRQIAPSNQGVVVHGWITEQCLPTGMCPETPDAEGCIRGAELPMDDPMHEPFLDVYRDLGQPTEFYFWIFEQATSFCQPHFMTLADLEMFSFETSNACTDTTPEAICHTPPGPFTESCRECFLDEPNLSCNCNDVGGTPQPTSLAVDECEQDVSNCNGVLTCGGDCPGPRPPSSIAFSSVVNPTESAAVPSDGSVSNDSCDQLLAVNRLSGNLVGGDFYIGSIQPGCIAPQLVDRGDGSYEVIADPTSVQDLPLRGTGSGSGIAAACPDDHFVVGFGHRAGTLVDQLVLHCAPLEVVLDPDTNAYVLEVGEVTMSAPFGSSGGTPFPDISCGDGEIATEVHTSVAIGFEGIEGFSLGCREVTLRPH